MASYLVHILVAIAVWWLATGIVAIVVRRRMDEGLFSKILSAGMAVASIGLLLASSRIETTTGAYLGFFGALGIWAWHELAFLSGSMTGPSRQPCPADAQGWRRFSAAFATVRHHEFALFATLLLIAVALAGQPNKTGLYMFALLWAMRLSTKLIVFLGAPNAISALLPERMTYLTTYFRTDRISPIYVPTLVVLLMSLLALCWAAAGAPPNHEPVGFTLLATFLGLAIVEHLFLVLPVSDSVLWRWAIHGSEES